MSGPHEHPYSVRGWSPRQVVEMILSAADDGRSMTVLEQMREAGVGFCDINDVVR